jgi:hypothetical protein
LTSQNYYSHETGRQVQLGFGTLLVRKIPDMITVLVKDKESVLLMLAAVLPLAIIKKGEMPSGHARLILLVSLVFFAIPIGLLISFAFPIYYWWMRYLPVCLAFVISLETLHRTGHVAIRNGSIILGLGLVLILGLPARLVLASLDSGRQNYRTVDAFVSHAIKQTDVVYADYPAFYPLARLKIRTYYYGYMVRITPEEAASINCLVVDPVAASELEKRLGGTWTATGQECLNRNEFGVAFLDRLMPNYFKSQTNRKYNLAIYRKIASPVVADTK